MEVRGKSCIPAKGNFILASNHLSNLDPPVLAVACPRRLAFAAKKELFFNRFLSGYFKAVGAVPVERKKAGVQTVRKLIKVIRSGPLLIFPEGTRGAGLERAYAGAGFLCQKAKVPVIAAKLSGTDKVKLKPNFFSSKEKIKIIFKLANIGNCTTPEEVTQKIIETIKNC